MSRGIFFLTVDVIEVNKVRKYFKTTEFCSSHMTGMKKFI